MAEGQEKTEQATPRKRQEARERGNVCKSADLNAVLVFLACLFVGRALLLALLDASQRMFRSEWSMLADPAVSVQNFAAFSTLTLRHFAVMLWPFLAAAGVTAILSNVLQVGFLTSSQVLRFDLNRINPVQGAKRLFSMRGTVELVKAVLKIVLVSYAAYSTLWGRREWLFVLPEQTAMGVLLVVADITFQVCLRAAIMLLLLAIADYGFQRWHFEKDLRMSRQEIRDEFKRTEGDPLLRQRIRQRQREVAMRRMMAEVPKADVVITNPTRLAIALRYDPSEMSAPRVTAKGQLLIAERIRDAAREARVPVIENKPLARSLYDGVEVGQEIPVALYEAVSEILAYVYRMKGRVPAYAGAA